MDPPPQPSPTTAKRENLIQGPRPAPLRVSNDSYKIKKPPKHPQPPPAPSQPAPPSNQPVIIYSVSPKPYFVEASDFRSLVQHLTGRDTASPKTSTAFGAGDQPPSPAARLAALERTSPKERDCRRGDASMTVAGETDVEIVNQMPGILSPAPANLLGISPGMFSPAPEEWRGFLGMSELMSPFMGNLGFLPSPQSLFFSNSPIVCPSPNADFFNIFEF